MDDFEKRNQFSLHHPIKFHDFSGDKDCNYAGFGIKSIKEIKENENIILMSSELGLVSNVLLDDEEKKDNDEKLHNEITSYTDQLSKIYFPHEL